MEGVVLHTTISEHGHLYLWCVLRVWGNTLKLLSLWKDMLKFEQEKRAGWVDMDRVISDAGLLRNELRYMCRTCFLHIIRFLKHKRFALQCFSCS